MCKILLSLECSPISESLVVASPVDLLPPRRVASNSFFGTRPVERLSGHCFRCDSFPDRALTDPRAPPRIVSSIHVCLPCSRNGSGALFQRCVPDCFGSIASVSARSCLGFRRSTDYPLSAILLSAVPAIANDIRVRLVDALPDRPLGTLDNIPNTCCRIPAARCCGRVCREKMVRKTSHRSPLQTP